MKTVKLNTKAIRELIKSRLIEGKVRALATDTTCFANCCGCCLGCCHCECCQNLIPPYYYMDYTVTVSGVINNPDYGSDCNCDQLNGTFTLHLREGANCPSCYYASNEELEDPSPVGSCAAVSPGCETGPVYPKWWLSCAPIGGYAELATSQGPAGGILTTTPFQLWDCDEMTLDWFITEPPDPFYYTMPCIATTPTTVTITAVPPKIYCKICAS